MDKSFLKTFWVVAGLAVVIVGVGAWTNNFSDIQALIRGHKTNPTPTSTASTNNATYNQLLQTYRNARIQFGQTCQATPVISSFRNGATIMLDNHSNRAHIVSVGGTNYTLPVYGHQIITLVSPTIPGTLNVNCDESVNVSTIRISQ